MKQVDKGLRKMQRDKVALSNLTLWDWIINILNAI